MLEQVREEPRELFALGGGARLPVRPEAAPSDLGEIEDVLGDGANGLSALPGLGLFLQLRVAQNFQDPVGGVAELLGRRAGERGADRKQAQCEHEQPGVNDPRMRHQPSPTPIDNRLGTIVTLPTREGTRRAERRT